MNEFTKYINGHKVSKAMSQGHRSPGVRDSGLMQIKSYNRIKNFKFNLKFKKNKRQK